MPASVIDTDAIRPKVRNGEIPLHYGFEPNVEYLIRARNRAYNGISEGVYQFVNGEAVAGAMRSDATEEQRWARGNRLIRLAQAHSAGGRSYAVYRRGEEPPAHEEPMWFGQEMPESELLDTGEERYTAARPPGASSPSGYVVAPQATGESAPKPRARYDRVANKVIIPDGGATPDGGTVPTDSVGDGTPPGGYDD